MISNYIQQINDLTNPTFKQIQNIAKSNCNINCPGLYSCKPWKDLNHGVDLLDTHEKLCKYLCAYGDGHEEKMAFAFDTIKQPQNIFNHDITIIDWGCGQGLATLCFFDYLNQKHLPNNTSKVILIEPSEMALQRAELHVTAYLRDSEKVKLIKKKLDDVLDTDLVTETSTVLHLFSNIIDIQSVQLKILAENVSSNSLKEQYVFCITPLYSAARRVDGFYNYFDQPHVIANERISILPLTKNTLRLLVFKLEAGKTNLIQVKYYPPVQFHTAYQLDCVKQSINVLSKEEKQKYDLLSTFEVAAPFDIGASIYDDVHPIFAVLHNMVIRGLPTRTSPYIETVFKSLGNQRIVDELGNIRFVHNKLHTDNLLSSVECLTPIAIARVQKTILEALMTSRVSLSEKKWRVLVVERDVPCAAIAFEDLKQMFNHLAALSKDYSNLKFPEIQLEIISQPEFIASPLHLGIKTTTTPTNQQKTTEYDMVIDVSVFLQSDIENLQFSEFSKCKNNCYFNIRSAVKKRSERYIYTSDTIEYKPLVSKDGQGIYKEISKTKEHLQYFLQLLFRKEDFRPGQLPILDRALQNKSVIGLLPTGGGKSLTYQLAAMLQPGVTIIIDPLRSLMKDQYDGLIKAGIDTCTFINSTQDPKEKEDSAKQMESSQMQFVFMSPERLCIYKFRERLQTMRELNVYFAYGVIDEVHCVSEWGHDFRFSYLHLGRNLYNYVLPKNIEKRITLFGLTATASFDVLADVERELSGNGAFALDSDTIIRYENTNRLELQYKIEKVNASVEAWVIEPQWEVFKAKNGTTSKFISKIPDLIDELQTSESIDFIKSRFIERENLDNEANSEQVGNTKKSDLTIKLLSDWLQPKEIYSSGGIVFCPHTKGLLGIDSTAAHKGIAEIIKTNLKCTVGTFKGGDKMNDQDRFINNKVPIMVATKAFGMGIDKPNVRFTLNVNMSSSLEGFVQEAGRAGRDKRMALATVLFSDIKDVDKDVQMYFHDNNFKGKEFEKKIMNKLLSHNKTDVFIGDDVEFKDGFETVADFLEKYFSTDINTDIVAFIKYPQQKTPVCNFDFVFWDGKEVKLVKEVKDKVIIEHLGKLIQVNKEDVIYKSDISKAIYRMTCIELISDFTEDYAKNRYRIVTKRKTESDFYLNLKRFLLRYFSTDRAELEIQKVKALILPKPADSELKKELYQCLNYLTEFIYEKIAIKRKRAIDDMKTFCAIGIDNSKDWKLVNEELKDFLYYYFNSKYAKGDYTANNEELFSLTTDTDFGKGKDLKFSPDIVFKYMRVIDIDDPMFGPGETPKDNAKHLQGAVRLIRRSLTDINPALDLLNAFCLLYLGVNNNETLEKELQQSYFDGLWGFFKTMENYNLFWAFFDQYHNAIAEKAKEYPAYKIEKLRIEAMTSIHAGIIREITKKYT